MTSFAYVLGLGDDALIAAQRLAEWCSRAHSMEEDIALTNIALDQLGVARLLLTYAGELEGRGRTEDDLAYLRDDREFTNIHLVERPNGDFAVTIAKLLLLSAFQKPLYDHLATSSDDRLAAIAGKARKESAYHLDHSAQWTVRLGDGTDESHARMQAAIDGLWPYTSELLDIESTVAPQWTVTVDEVLKRATLDKPADSRVPTGGRAGRHTEALSYLLGEMQVLHRAHPGARW
jgi:ring-1,2-phenylacetyl-CoA epoxidase subunit PaaC